MSQERVPERFNTFSDSIYKMQHMLSIVTLAKLLHSCHRI